MRIVILAAGVGSRLGSSDPKPLTSLSSGETILGRMLRLLAEAFPHDSLLLVVGYKKDLVMEHFPNVLFVYNRDYGNTNTSKSLLRALELTTDEPVLWLNGDVVFDEAVLVAVAESIDQGESFVLVNTTEVGHEEIKYTVDSEGYIAEISKAVDGALGEAVGINYISALDKPFFVRRLRECKDDEYFERGLETAITMHELRIRPIDISQWTVIEVDFLDDLATARERF